MLNWGKAMRRLILATAALALLASPVLAKNCRDAATGKFVKCATTTTAPAPAAPPAGSTGVCKDGTYTDAKNHKGACSHHGGVAKWL